MKILIIDDERGIIEFFSGLARAREYEEVDTAGSGEEGLTLATLKTYDLITLDIHMPGACGLEIVAMLRNMNPHAVIAVISGHISEPISSEEASCIDTMISKPVSMETFDRFLQHARRICENLEEIRLLGQFPQVIRQ